jgi:hypothetical protein
LWREWYIQLELEPVWVAELPEAVVPEEPEEAELVASATAPVAGKKCEL